jgi:hypothetical protein
MTLYEHLKQARSEEDVKDAYIKALGLKGFTKGLIEKLRPMVYELGFLRE